MRTRSRCRTAVAVVAACLAVQPFASNPARSADPPLRDLADRIPLRIGATLEPSQIDDPDYAGTLAREFNALTAENAMKWYSIQV